MRYFIVKQEEKMEHGIKLRDFPTMEKAYFGRKDEKRMKGITSLAVTGADDAVYPDVVLAPLLMVADRVKAVFQLYEENLIYKNVVFANVAYQTQKVYRLVLTDLVEAVSEKTTYYDNGWEKNLVLDEAKTEGRQIFHLKAKQENYFIISLDVAESMLKRGFRGFTLKEIEVDANE